METLNNANPGDEITYGHLGGRDHSGRASGWNSTDNNNLQQKNSNARLKVKKGLMGPNTIIDTPDHYTWDSDIETSQPSY